MSLSQQYRVESRIGKRVAAGPSPDFHRDKLGREEEIAGAPGKRVAGRSHVCPYEAAHDRLIAG